VSGRRRTVAALFAPVVLAVLCAALWLVRPVSVKTSLFDLVGDVAEQIPAAVREQSANIVPVVVSSPDLDQTVRVASALSLVLPTNDCIAVRTRVDGEFLENTLDFYATNRAGLASSATKGFLATEKGRVKVARLAARRAYSSLVPSLFTQEVDPFGLLDGFVASMPMTYSGWSPRRGFLMAERDGVCHALLVMVLKRQLVGDVDALIEFKARFDEACASVAEPGADIVACGVPMHTATAASRCKSEIGWLTLFSALFIAVLSIVVFCSAKWLCWIALSLVLSALAGSAALLLLFRSVHIMTLVFGTTLLGLVIDYAFHWLLQTPGRRRAVTKGLVVSFLTTEVSLIPLALSSLPVLRQSATFLGFGLAASLAAVLLLYPRPVEAEPSSAGGDIARGRASKTLEFVFLLTLIAVIAGLPFARFGTDVSALYVPSRDLMRTERLLAELSGGADADRGIVVTEGSDDLEELLAKEASLGLPDNVARLSCFLPTIAERRAVADDVAKLYAEHGVAHAELIGLKTMTPPPQPEPWSWERLPPIADRAFVYKHSLVVPSTPEPQCALPEGVSFCRPKALLESVLSDWTHEARIRLGVALVLMAVILAAIFGRLMFILVLPSIFALGAVFGALGLMGEKVNLFHLLAGFLLMGMSVDYTVFLFFGGRTALKSAACSLLTSLAGFGALVFVSFPVVRAFGIALGVGLPVAFLSALCFGTCGHAPERDERRTEHAATPLGLSVLWFVYCLFGLRALHFLAGAVGFFAWVFSRSVRHASPRLAKTVGFTRSLADKLVVMAGGRRLPKVETDGSSAAKAFMDDVREGKGVFVLSSHVGTIEVLAALGECKATFHAWMEFERTGVFNAFYLGHARRGKVQIHPVSEFGPETVFFAGDALDAGDCLLMAGDRSFGRIRHERVGGRELALAEGAFRFARALGHPVYFVACVASGSCRYEAVVRRLPSDDSREMSAAYARELAAFIDRHPDQWFVWND